MAGVFSRRQNISITELRQAEKLSVAKATGYGVIFLSREFFRKRLRPYPTDQSVPEVASAREYHRET